MSSSKIQKVIAFSQQEPINHSGNMKLGKESEEKDLGNLMERLNIEEMDDDDFFENFDELYECKFEEEQVDLILNPQMPIGKRVNYRKRLIENSNFNIQKHTESQLLQHGETNKVKDGDNNDFHQQDSKVMTPSKNPMKNSDEIKLEWAPQKPHKCNEFLTKQDQ